VAPPLHIVIASAAKQSSLHPRRDSGLLRCARNDGVLGDDVTLKTNISNRRHTFSPSRLISPELCFISPPSQSGGRREDRVLTSHPRSAARKCSAGKPHSSIQVWPNTRPSLRDGLTAYAVLSREPNSFWPPSPRELTMRFTRLGSPHLRDSLTVATTARTTRFCRTRVRPMPQRLSAVCTRAESMLARRTSQRRSSTRGFGLTGTTRPARTSRADAAASTASPARNS